MGLKRVVILSLEDFFIFIDTLVFENKPNHTSNNEGFSNETHNYFLWFPMKICEPFRGA